MDDRRRERLGSLLEQALALPSEARERFLTAECDGDSALQDELRTLLAALDAAPGHLERLASRFAQSALAVATEHPTSQLEVGQRVAHYEVIERIGDGGMGVVYKARDTRLGRIVALKFLRPDIAADASARERLVAEARAASALDHPNIGVVHEIGETDGDGAFIALAWYDGETLKQRLQHGAVPPPEALAFAIQIASALAVAHSAGIIHRDVKPSNIIIGRAGLLKLVDFGIAKVTGVELTREGTTLGTLAYMSPEQTRGDAVDARTDLWSLGVVLYEMLAGQRPFRGSSDETVIHAIRHDEPTPIDRLCPNLSGAAIAVVEQCLAKDAARRPANAEAMGEALRAAGAGAGDAVSSPGVRRQVLRRLLRWRTGLRTAPRSERTRVGYIAALAAAAVLALFAAAGYFVTGRGEAPVLDEQRVVVARFDNRTGDASLDAVGSIAADWITDGLARTGLVQLVPVTAALAASRVPGGGAADGDGADRAGQVARETGAGIVIAGAYSRQGDSLYIWATATDAVRHRVLFAVEPFATRADEPLNAIVRLRQQLLGGLAPHLDPRMRNHAARLQAAPPSYDAYAAFAAGLEQFIGRDWRVAILRFREATAIDPEFAPPYIYAGISHVNLGETAAVDSILTIARPRLHQLPEVDRLAFDLLDALVRGDFAAAYRAQLRAPELAPGSLAHWGLANSAMWVNRPRETVRVSRELDPERGELRSWYFYWRDLGRAHHRLGEHREELRVARLARARFPEEPQTVWREARALAALRRHDELRRLLADHLASQPNPPLLLRQVGLELLAHGAPREGAALLRTSLEHARARPSDLPGIPVFLAESHVLASEPDEAERLLLAVAAERPQAWEVRAHLGAIAARRGDAAEARQVSEWLATVERPHLRGRHTYWRARIAAILGRHDEAVRLLRQAYGEGVEVWDIMHTEPDFMPLRDFRPFQEFARPLG